MIDDGSSMLNKIVNKYNLSSKSTFSYQGSTIKEYMYSREQVISSSKTLTIYLHLKKNSKFLQLRIINVAIICTTPNEQKEKTYGCEYRK